MVAEVCQPINNLQLPLLRWRLRIPLDFPLYGSAVQSRAFSCRYVMLGSIFHDDRESHHIGGTINFTSGAGDDHVKWFRM